MKPRPTGLTLIELPACPPTCPAEALGRRRKARRGQAQRAFTLVELLVVMAIISILAALLLPVLGRALQAARQTQCLSNMRQAYLGETLYVNDWTVYMADMMWDGNLVLWNESGPGPKTYQSWERVLESDYEIPRSTFFCPEKLIYITPKARGYCGNRPDIDMNEYAFSKRFVRPSKIIKPLYMFGETRKWWYESAGGWSPGTNFNCDNSGMSGFDRHAHGDRVNIIFADGTGRALVGEYVAATRHYSGTGWYPWYIDPSGRTYEP